MAKAGTPRTALLEAVDMIAEQSPRLVEQLRARLDVGWRAALPSTDD